MEWSGPSNGALCCSRTIPSAPETRPGVCALRSLPFSKTSTWQSHQPSCKILYCPEWLAPAWCIMFIIVYQSRRHCQQVFLRVTPDSIVWVMSRTCFKDGYSTHPSVGVLGPKGPTSGISRQWWIAANDREAHKHRCSEAAVKGLPLATVT